MKKIVFVLLITFQLFTPAITIKAEPDSLIRVGTNVIADNGTIYYIGSNKELRPYTSAGAFLSYGFNSFNFVQKINDTEKSLQTGISIPPSNGSLVCSDRGTDKGTCYHISDFIGGGVKSAFTSKEVFLAQGYKFSNVLSGDVSWIKNSKSINEIDSAHRPGSLVNDNGTIKIIGYGESLAIPDLATFESWGFKFENVVKASLADKETLEKIYLLKKRVQGELVPSLPPFVAI